MTRHAQLWKITTMALALIAYAGLATTALTGCNTMSGAGKDIKKGGESLENSADKHK